MVSFRLTLIMIYRQMVEATAAIMVWEWHRSYAIFDDAYCNYCSGKMGLRKLWFFRLTPAVKTDEYHISRQKKVVKFLNGFCYFIAVVRFLYSWSCPLNVSSVNFCNLHFDKRYSWPKEEQPRQFAQLVWPVTIITATSIIVFSVNREE